MNARIMTIFIAAFAMAILLFTSQAYAADISVLAPLSGAIVNTDTDTFSFAISTGETIGTCELFVNDTVEKTLPYNNVLKGRSLSLKVPIEDGPVTWHVSCSTSAGTITTEKQSITVQNTPADAVTARSSGVTRGSMIYSFKIRNNAEQQPVVIRKLAAGDFIEIQLYVPPSTMKRELYIKQRSSKDGVPYLWLEDLKKNEYFYLYQGENTTVNVSNSHIFLQFTGTENNRATVVAYPSVTTALGDADGGADDGTSGVDDEDGNGIDGDGSRPDGAGTGSTGTDDTGAEDTETDADAGSETGSGSDTAPDVPVPDDAADDGPGAFARFFGWLKGLFG